MIWKTKQGWSSAMTIEILWWYDNDKLRNSLTYSWEILYNITERNMLKLVRGRWRAYLSGVFWGVLWGRESMIFGWLQRLSRILPHGKQGLNVAGFYLSSFVHLSYCASSVTRGEVWQLIDSTNWIVLTAITVTQRITRSRLVNLGQCSVKNSGIRVKRCHYGHLYWHVTKSKFWEIWSNKHTTHEKRQQN